jgi:pimeloyl-ACP methyl ester carboxylesterase
MRIVFVVLLVSVLAAGCGNDADDQAGPATLGSTTPSTTAAAPCGSQGVQAVTLTTQEGTEVQGALVGEGETGVVLGHQFRSDFCSWVPFAQELARRGVGALAINFASIALDEDLVAGAEELRRRGARRILLVGASMGGTAALVAAAETQADAVAAVSAPREFSGLDALPAVRQLSVPTLFLVARQDSRFARDARRLYRPTKAREKTLVVTTGFEHGTELLQDPKAMRALLDFVARESAG